MPGSIPAKSTKFQNFISVQLSSSSGLNRTNWQSSGSKKNSSYLKYTSVITLILGLIAAFLSIETATSGGEMRHTEIRKDFVVPDDKESDKDQDE